MIKVPLYLLADAEEQRNQVPGKDSDSDEDEEMMSDDVIKTTGGSRK